MDRHRAGMAQTHVLTMVTAGGGGEGSSGVGDGVAQDRKSVV